MHECVSCGQACACDIEDTWLDAPEDCTCPCWDEPDDESELLPARDDAA